MADDLAPRYRDPSQPVAERISDLGHGRGYTTFAYSDLAQARVPIDGSEDIALAFTVRNTGRRSGVEVAQLYCVTATPAWCGRCASWRPSSGSCWRRGRRRGCSSACRWTCSN